MQKKNPKVKLRRILYSYSWENSVLQLLNCPYLPKNYLVHCSWPSFLLCQSPSAPLTRVYLVDFLVQDTCFYFLFFALYMYYSRSTQCSSHSLIYTLKPARSPKKREKGRAETEAEDKLPIIVGIFKRVPQLGVSSSGFLRSSVLQLLPTLGWRGCGCDQGHRRGDEMMCWVGQTLSHMPSLRYSLNLLWLMQSLRRIWNCYSHPIGNPTINDSKSAEARQIRGRCGY